MPNAEILGANHSFVEFHRFEIKARFNCPVSDNL